MIVHTLFDVAAAGLALAMTWWVWRWRLAASGPLMLERAGSGYAFALVAGAALGGYALGTANLWLTGIGGIGRSIVGALAGAILAVGLRMICGEARRLQWAPTLPGRVDQGRD